MITSDHSELKETTTRHIEGSLTSWQSTFLVLATPLARTFDQFQGTLCEDAGPLTKALDWLIPRRRELCYDWQLPNRALWMAMLENETGRACRDPNGFSQRFFERCSSGSPQDLLPPNRILRRIFLGGIPKFQGGFHMGKLKKNTGTRYLKIWFNNTNWSCVSVWCWIPGITRNYFFLRLLQWNLEGFFAIKMRGLQG